MTTFVDRGGAYVMHVFNSPGSLAVTHGGTIEYLVVAGGGSGSLGAWETAGGGAGGVQTGIITLDAGAYVIAVGIGGSGCSNGSNSSIDGVAPRLEEATAVARSAVLRRRVGREVEGTTPEASWARPERLGKASLAVKVVTSATGAPKVEEAEPARSGATGKPTRACQEALA